MSLHFCTNRFEAETVTRPRRPWHQINGREIFMTTYDGGNDDGGPSESYTVVRRMCYSERDAST
jgi:hypothetical protein